MKKFIIIMIMCIFCIGSASAADSCEKCKYYKTVCDSIDTQFKLIVKNMNASNIYKLREKNEGLVDRKVYIIDKWFFHLNMVHAFDEQYRYFDVFYETNYRMSQHQTDIIGKENVVLGY